MTDQDSFHKFEHGFWDKTSTLYDAGFGDTTSQTIPHLLLEVGAKQGDVLLDVACGPGYVTAICAKKGINVIGVDFSNAMIDLARQKNPQSEFHFADAAALPFADESFDGVTCNFGVLHFPDPLKAMSEAYRVCKTGGRYSFALWNTAERSPALSVMMNAIQSFARPVENIPQGLPFFHFANEQNCVEAMTQAGFSDIRFKTINVFWKINSPEDFVNYFKDGGARIGAILRAQTPDALFAINVMVKELLFIYQGDEGYDVPVSFVVVSGRK